jgi:hypothetical protein
LTGEKEAQEEGNTEALFDAASVNVRRREWGRERVGVGETWSHVPGPLQLLRDILCRVDGKTLEDWCFQLSAKAARTPMVARQGKRLHSECL